MVDIPEIKPDRLRDRLAKLQGQEFDREYVKTMVKDHKQDVAEFRRMHSGAVDPNLKAWVDKTLPTIEQQTDEEARDADRI